MSEIIATSRRPTILRHVASHSSLMLVLALRGAQMLLAFLILRLTYFALSAADFVLFNTALFALGLASAGYAPSLRALWRRGDAATAQTSAIVNVGLSALVALIVMLPAVARLRGMGFASLCPAVFGAMLYCGTRAVERTLYAYGFTRRNYRVAFVAPGLFLLAELAVLMGTRSLALGSRLMVPSLLFAIMLLAIYRHQRPGPLGRVGHFFAGEYLNGTGLKTIGYTALFTICGIAERAYPLLRGQAIVSTPDFKAYLLLLSYGVAFQSLLSISVDWARPRLTLAQDNPSAVLVAALSMMVASFGFAACVGYPLFVATGLLPEWIRWPLWSLVLLRFTAQTALFCCQVDLVLSGRLVRAMVPWALLLGLQLMLIPHDLSPAALWPVLEIVAGLTGAFALIEALLLQRRLRRRTQA